MLVEIMTTDKGITDIEIKVGTKAGFFDSLRHEDDWSFIIKLHAFFESICTHLLLFHFQEPTLSKIISRLELSNTSTGKLAFLSDLELLGKPSRRFIISLSEIRNSIVHDIKNCEFKLSQYICDLDENQMKQFAIAFSPFETYIRNFSKDKRFVKETNPKLIKQAKIETIIESAQNDPKTHIWYGAHHVLVSLIDSYGYSDYKKWVKSKNEL